MSTLIEPQPRNSSTDAPTDSDAAAKQVGRGPRILASLLRLLLPLAVIALAIWFAVGLIRTRPVPPRMELPPRTTIVETLVPEPTTERLEIIAYGTVEPKQRLVLQPQVGGQVIELNDALAKGGRVSEGEVLYRIDPRDYELAVQQRLADVASAEVALQKEHALQVVAEREWELLGDSVATTESGRQLARREPQRLQAEANLAAAEGRLSLAKLNLERTTMRAPFNAIVIEDMIEIGQVIAPLAPTATLVGTDTYDVIVSIPLEDLAWIMADEEDPTKNSPARVILELGDGHAISRDARVDRIAGEVERAGRLAKVIVEVAEPLASDNARSQLLLGSYVRVQIEGPEVEDVYVLPRAVMHENDTIRIMDNEGQLAIRTVDVVVGRPETVLVRAFLQPGEEIIASPLSVAIPGMLMERLGIAGFQRTDQTDEQATKTEPTP
ncbi:MAG: efflux RND transporter periplasmic adaptor subunit [Phycisphaerales bacterium]|nr:efflux RND transporter periplasmic adaptor subunit [Phycisphaerales bacterium]